MTSTRLPRPTRLTVLALLGSAVAFVSEMLGLGSDVSVSVVVASVLVAAALAATGWRWAPALAVATIVTIMANNPFLVANLSLANGSGLFVSTAINVACAGIAVVAGTAATLRNYRRLPRPQ